MEFRGIIFGIPEMVGTIAGEGSFALEEIVIVSQSLIPGGIPGSVQIVIVVAQLDDIPSMATAIADTGDDTAVDVHLQSQAIQQQRIALAHGGFVDHRRIGGVFQSIVVIIQIIIIIYDILAHPVVHLAQLFIVAAFGVHRGQHRIHRFIQLLFLCGSGVVGHGVGEGRICHAVGDLSADPDSVTGIIPAQSVALLGIAGMGHSRLENILMVGAVVRLGLVADRNGLLTGDHPLAQLRAGTFKCGSVIAIIPGILGIHTGGTIHEILFRDHIRIQWVDVDVTLTLRCHGSERDHAQDQHQDQQKTNCSFHG